MGQEFYEPKLNLELWHNRGEPLPDVSKKYAGIGNIWVSCADSSGRGPTLIPNLQKAVNQLVGKGIITTSLLAGGHNGLARGNKTKLALLEYHLTNLGMLVVVEKDLELGFRDIIAINHLSYPHFSIMTIPTFSNEIEIMADLLYNPMFSNLYSSYYK